jgi:serine/threonine protein kinase/predicted Zn-dependent protease
MNEETLFHVVLGKPLGEREAFLKDACDGDETLRQRVQALLDAHENAASFLKQPAGEALPPRATTPENGGVDRGAETTDDPPPGIGPGSLIGPYKLMQKLGEGGMGTVHVAQQEHPVKRRVALKIIKSGMDSAHVIARFEQERQALALMDHPNIAKVLDAGTTQNGLPYFVMELVKGIPITKFCDQERLTPRERLELFIPVCHAVQHAHQKGIIHRDLKPSNVIIALYDGKPVPKVIDFGVAKATSQKLTEGTVFTEVGQMVGTLEYMAPEQAELNNLDIDTRADIYALGVVLYELLTGSPPFTGKQLRSAAFSEMLRMIREVEPPKPSTKLSSSDELPGIAAKRKLEPKRLTRLIQGDLDWIIMKCLEKERGRRYETANGLALDVLRYLHEEPVLAGPPRASYRLRKFLRRNRHGVIAAGILLVTLLAGLTGTTWGLLEARWQRDRAWRAEAEARDQESKARANFELARDSVEEYGSKISNDARLKEKDLEDLRKELLQSAVKFHQQFVEQHRDDPTLRADLGQAYLDLSALVGESDYTQAVQLSRQAAAIYEELIVRDPAEGSYPLQRTQALLDLGSVMYSHGQTKEAREAWEQALQTLEQVREQQGSSRLFRRRYVRACVGLGHTLDIQLGLQTEAIATYRKAAALLEDGQASTAAELTDLLATAALYGSLGSVLSESGTAPQEGLLWCEKGLQLLQSRLSRTHRPADLLSYLAYAYCTAAEAQQSLFEYGSAVQSWSKAVELSEELVTAHPGVAKYQFNLGGYCHNLYLAELKAGKPQQALISLKKAVEVKERLAVRFPDVPDYQANLVRSLAYLTTLTKDLEQARAFQQRAEVLARELNRLHPGVAQYQTALADSLRARADLHQRANEIQKAIAALDEEIHVWEKLVQTMEVAQHRTGLTNACLRKSVLALQAGKPELGAEAFRKAAALHPTDPALYYEYGAALMNANRLEDALLVLNKAVALKPDFAEAECDLGHCLVRQGRFVEGRAALQRGHELGSKRPGWSDLSAQWVQDADKLVQLDGRLTAIQSGKAQPTDAAEQLALASFCRSYKRLYGTAARFYAGAFAERPLFAEDRKAAHRYNAACAAALAGCGRGADTAQLNDKERSHWRQESRNWLQADLDFWVKEADNGQATDRAAVCKVLRGWQTDTDLAGVREEGTLTHLPAEEQPPWRKLWADVQALLGKLGQQ